jgi:16S rRNA (guanine966-N2)-methyltransferase
MAKEAIFSMLEPRGGLDGLIVADLYCGSGGLGIEALSRGAARVYFVDENPDCLAAASANAEPSNWPARPASCATDFPVGRFPTTSIW